MSSSTVTRRFGTDVSNIPSSVLQKNPKKVTKPRNRTPKTQVTKTTNAERKLESPSRPLFDVMESLMDSLVSEIVVDDEITIKSPIYKSAPSGEFRYEREYLLSFQQTCKEPLEGLIPEVIPGFVFPDALSSQMSSVVISSSNQHAYANENDSNAANSNLRRTSSAVVSSSEVIPSRSSKIAPSSSASDIEAPSCDASWRSTKKDKAVKKDKPKESDERRLAARQKQLDIGMNTDGYRRYMSSTSTENRTKVHPRIPDIHQVCSKRSWDGQVRKWRRQLHDYDLPEAAGGDGLTSAADNNVTEPSFEEEDSSENEEGEEEQVVA